MPKRAIQGRRVKVFKNGRNRAVRIPRAFEFPGDEAVMRKEGRTLILEPVRRESLLEYVAKASRVEEDFPEIPDMPPRPVDL